MAQQISELTLEEIELVSGGDGGGTSTAGGFTGTGGAAGETLRGGSTNTSGG